MSIQHAKNALALIDHVVGGPGAYRDENLIAVSGVKTWLRKVADGSLAVVDVVKDPPKPETPETPK